MQRVGSRFGNLIYDRSARTPVLGAEIGSLDRNFLKRIVVRERRHWAGDRNIVIVHPIDQEVIGARPSAVDSADAAIQRTSQFSLHRAGNGDEQIQRILSNQRYLLDLKLRDRLCPTFFRALQLKSGKASFNVDDFA